MKRNSMSIAALLGVLTGAMSLRAATPELITAPATTAPADVTTINGLWQDAQRDRAVPYKIYLPKTLPAGTTIPVIVFSHGLGGSCEGYAFLGQHWASRGYASVHLTHHGSDTAALRGAEDIMKATSAVANDLRNSVDRVKDVSFALDQLTTMNKDDAAVKGKLDLEKIGMAGHFFGGSTTMWMIGQKSGSPLDIKGIGGDPRIKAAIPMSAPAARGPNIQRAYGSITTPVLCMTGTLDDSPAGETRAADRRMPFDNMVAAERYLVIFEGGDHMVFSGWRSPMRAGKRPGTLGDPAKDPRFHALILQSTDAFWDAYLKGDEKAKTYLREGFARDLGKDGTWSAKKANEK